MLAITLTDAAQLAAAAATGVLAVLTLTYVWVTWRMVKEMREARLAQTRPYMVIDIENSRHTLCDMVISNIGNGPATDVDIKFEPEQMYEGEPLSHLPLFSQMKFVAPGREYRFFYRQLVGENIDPLREGFIATIKYSDTTGHSYQEAIHLNPFIRWNLMQLDEKDMTDLVKTVEDIPKKLHDATAAIKALEATLRYELRASTAHNLSRDSHRDQLITKLHEIAEFWNSLFSPSVKDDNVYHSPSLFQARCHRLAMDLTAIADSWEPGPTDRFQRVNHALVQSVAENLFDMSALRMYLDGGLSVAAFQRRGDELARVIGEAGIK